MQPELFPTADSDVWLRLEPARIRWMDRDTGTAIQHRLGESRDRDSRRHLVTRRTRAVRGRTVIVDPHFRGDGRDLLAPSELERLRATVDVVWGRDEPMPSTRFSPGAARGDRGRQRRLALRRRARRGVEPPGDSHRLRRLAAGDRLRECFERGIRVLSAAPAFAGAVAEMALGLALACSRDIAPVTAAMRAGDERWLERG